MTSPVGGKPEPTQDRYNDVHSIGSSFGADLDESSVRSLLGNQVKSPFASIVTGVANAFGSLINDIADAITGIIPAGARTEPIKNAIVAKMGPLESEVLALGESLAELSAETVARIEEQAELVRSAEAELSTIHTLLQEQKEYEEATREALNDAEIAIGEAEAWMGINQEKIDEAQNKALESHQVLFDAQTGWNKTQERITESLVKSTEANTQALSVQSNVNKLFQEQLWTQQDMIEQLDIQATKIYHGAVSSKRYTGIPSWVGWSEATQHIFPLVHFYTRDDRDRMVKWQLTGSWTGKVKVITNWSNGAVDVEVFDVLQNGIFRNGDSSRTQTTSGGAAAVNLRNVTFEVFPTSLDRRSTLTVNNGEYSLVEEEQVRGFPSMIRYQGDEGFRFSCPVLCDKELTLNVFEDGKWTLKTFPVYSKIMPTFIEWSRVPSSATFTESKVYSL